MRELTLNELTTEQKIGMTMIAFASTEEKQISDCVELVKKHSLGGVYIPSYSANRDKFI